MSKKDISRTIIEGGRRKYNKFERSNSHRVERQYSREFCTSTESDPEIAEKRSVAKRPKVSKEFDDKLSPIYKWLKSFVGQPWNDVYSLIRSKFDTRTTAGRHIVFDHLLSSVVTSPTDKRAGDKYGADFIVDEEGILTLGPHNRWERKKRLRDKKDDGGNWHYASQAELSRWAGGRNVIDYGATQFWTTPSETDWRDCPYFWQCGRDHRMVDSKRVRSKETYDAARGYEKTSFIVEQEQDGRTSYYQIVKKKQCMQPVGLTGRQGEKFTKEESAFWINLHSRQKNMFLFETSAQKERRHIEEGKRYKLQLKAEEERLQRRLARKR